MLHDKNSLFARLMRRVQQSPVWFLAPAAVVSAAVVTAVNGYSPLVFDESAYATTQDTTADELSRAIDAAAIEEANAEANATEASFSAETSAAASGVSADKLADGTYRGYARCTESDIFDYYLGLDVTISGGKVTNISNVHGSGTGNEGSANLGTYQTENDPYLQWAAYGRTLGSKSYTGTISQILADAKQGTITSNIDVVSGATYSCKSILNSYYDALKKASAASGSSTASIEIPADTSVEPAAGGKEEEEVINIEPSADIPVAEEGYVDGSYTGYGYNDSDGSYSTYYVAVTVEVADGEIVGVSSVKGDADGVVDPTKKYSAAENSTYLKRALFGYGVSGKNIGVGHQLNAFLAGLDLDQFLEYAEAQFGYKKTKIIDMPLTVLVPLLSTVSGETSPTIPTALNTGAKTPNDRTVIDTISGATYSSRAVFDGFVAAVKSIPLKSSVTSAGDGTNEEESADAPTASSSEGDESVQPTDEVNG